jgi:hypothetical protein
VISYKLKSSSNSGVHTCKSKSFRQSRCNSLRKRVTPSLDVSLNNIG